MDEVFVARRRRCLQYALAAGCVALLAPLARAASIFPFIPDHYTFSRAQIQRVVERKFPLQRQMAQVFSITLTHPVIGLRPDANRITITVAALLESPFVQQPLNGTVTLSSQLVYDQPSRSIVLHTPTVDRLDVGRLAGDYGPQIDAAAALAATQLLDNYPIYTFKPEELSFAGVGYEPGIITILSDGVRVQIVEH